MPVDLAPQHLKLLETILLRHLPQGISVYVFGSRARGTAKPFSDVDLALDAQGHILPAQTLGRMALDFEESAFPYKVDLVDLNAASPEFRQIIGAQKQLLLAT